MTVNLTRSQIALATVAAIGATTMTGAPDRADAAKTAGKYAAGDFHNHSTCSDGSLSMQKLIMKSVDKSGTPWGLDWFVQAGHGGSGNRNCTLVEDASLATPAYPLLTSPTGAVIGPQTTWQNSTPAVPPKGTVSGTPPNQNMWRWQAVQEFQYPLIEYAAAFLNKPLFLGIESVVAGHEHTSMAVITGQIPSALDTTPLPQTRGYTPLGNANALAMWQYCFDRGNADLSRGAQNNWDCSVTGSPNNADPIWNDAAKKLVPAGGAGTGVAGHRKTVEAIKWMKEFHPNGSYYIPAHLERAGPFNPDGNNGFNVEHLRNFNNAGPRVAFGMETQPGHGASSERGEYQPNRNNFGGVRVDSVGGTTYGGTGIYGAQIGGVWDALLGEGRNWWFFASSDWHNRGQFGPDDRRSTLDFYPGEYQRNYTMVRNGGDKMRPQHIVDGLRSGNTFVDSGQLIDRLAFVVCEVAPARVVNGQRISTLTLRVVERLVTEAARNNTDVDHPNCASMGEKLKLRAGASVIVSIVVRDPAGKSFAPYSFPNPSLLQVGVRQPLNEPVLNHVDVIRGMVSGYRTPGSAQYAGEWPRNWLTNPDMANVPAAAKNTSAMLLRSFGQRQWETLPNDPEYKRMTFRVNNLRESQYLRLRGTNLPPNVPFETDADGNPLADIHTNATDTDVAANRLGTLKIPCTTTTGSNVPANAVNHPAGAPAIDACPNHLPQIAGVRYVAYDVAAWADLWFYSNPIYIEVAGSTRVAGVD